MNLEEARELARSYIDRGDCICGSNYIIDHADRSIYTYDVAPDLRRIQYDSLYRPTDTHRYYGINWVNAIHNPRTRYKPMPPGRVTIRATLSPPPE